jgi:hypothetical protein
MVIDDQHAEAGGGALPARATRCRHLVLPSGAADDHAVPMDTADVELAAHTHRPAKSSGTER